MPSKNVSRLTHLKQRLARLRQAMPAPSNEVRLVHIRALSSALTAAVLDADGIKPLIHPDIPALLDVMARVNKMTRTLVDVNQKREADQLTRRIEALLHT